MEKMASRTGGFQTLPPDLEANRQNLSRMSVPRPLHVKEHDFPGPDLTDGAGRMDSEAAGQDELHDEVVAPVPSDTARRPQVDTFLQAGAG
ncbi:hypothetical protein [Aurantimonas endophytica]|uniref:Uncharacterized protein n=1 Tax=Aurantimonas endophytica TaxID=1522175 RepID=A0A7W6HIC9_9HYPH|nr:hypothetical protein [Aurantimonas endophytica]